MLYKSKAKVVFNVVSYVFALAAVVLVIISLVNKSDWFLASSILCASLFFIFKGISDYIDSKYCQRRDRDFMRHLSYVLFASGGICLIIGIVQICLNIIR